MVHMKKKKKNSNNNNNKAGPEQLGNLTKIISASKWQGRIETRQIEFQVHTWGYRVPLSPFVCLKALAAPSGLSSTLPLSKGFLCLQADSVLPLLGPHCPRKTSSRALSRVL